MQRTHLKRYRPGGPGSARLEALSLNWLADAPGGVRVARVLHQDESCLELEYFPPLGAQEGAGEAFGRALALTHAAGAPYFGAPPPLWSEHGWIGRAPMPFVRLPAAPTPGGSAAPAASVPPARSSSGAPAASVPPARSSSGAPAASAPAHFSAPGASGGPAPTAPGPAGQGPLASDPTLSWGAFYAAHRVLPYARLAAKRGNLSESGLDGIVRLAGRLEQGIYDAPQPGLLEGGAAARLHGDLWAGNVLWTQLPPDAPETWTGAALIDPAAHGGHAETDLAMLALFGLSDLDAVTGAYHEVSPLADGWRERVGLHQLFPLLVHAVVFGGSYGAKAEAKAELYL